MKALVWKEKGKVELCDRPMPKIVDPRDAIVRVTRASICSSDLHIIHGTVPRAKEGVVLGHEFVGEVVEAGSAVRRFKPGDRVAVNVESFCGECFFCKRGYVNNCVEGGWELGCRIDGGQAEYVRVPYADQGLDLIPSSVSDEQALFVGDILATGYWATRISSVSAEDTVLIIGAGPTGICTLLCVMLQQPRNIIVCERDAARRQFISEHYPQVLVTTPEDAIAFTRMHSAHGGADVVLEVAGSEDSFSLAWQCARPNALVTIVALYDQSQLLPLPDMYGKNLTFKTGGVDG
ncbi:MAG: alcohol dehydrogenase catalytic domain-containing protein, partial [Clostridium sp.]|nr:alcohol dehydrogenase catalytic domain-containing protein [Clostridium sp.]